jgi:hypothetical protein
LPLYTTDTTYLSISAWIKRTSSGAWQAIYASGTQTNLWGMYIDVNDKFDFSVTGIANHAGISSIGQATSAFYFPGQIDDVRIYNYALSPTQIKEIYNNGTVYFGPATGTP